MKFFIKLFYIKNNLIILYQYYVSAIRKSFTNVSWQRCQVHFLRNIFTTIPKKNSKSFREAVKGIFKFTDINLAREAKNRLIHEFHSMFLYIIIILP
ncbi:hypothetical protein B6175_00375 [Staphylococcus aureus]|nr:hypothetical protein B6175_00375 [Staphylococcus aureus]